jgi:hypothetical protein
MSDYHILITDKEYKKKQVSVVFHIPIPSGGTNIGGISWRDALVLELGGSANITSVLTGISAGEDTDLKAGALFEVLTNVRFSTVNLNNTQRRAEVEAKFTEISSNIISEKQESLVFMGVTKET